MSDASYDVVIQGGGMAGLALAAALIPSGLEVAVLESRRLRRWRPGGEPELRVSALTVASERILRNLGAWESMRRAPLSPFDAIEVHDSESGAFLKFDGADIGISHLGHIVENVLTQTALYDRVAVANNIQLFNPAAIAELRPQRSDRLELLLEDGRRIATRLLVGADGAGSAVRQAADIACERVGYGQVAIVGVIRCQRPHGQVARQRFLPGGPLALLPLADGRCSIVWSVPEGEHERLLGLSPEHFCAELTAASDAMLGEVLTVGERAGFALARQHAERYIAPRVALIGDAAHTIHPLAGQGINLGLLDAASLAQVIEQAAASGRDIGSMAVLRRYERWRKGENLLMQRAMDGFHLLFANRNPLLVGLRGLGLELTQRLPPVKMLYMHYAMGTGGDLPALATEKPDSRA